MEVLWQVTDLRSLATTKQRATKVHLKRGDTKKNKHALKKVDLIRTADVPEIIVDI